MGKVVETLKRILVIGVSGAGKSTLARAAAERLELPFIPTDDLYWSQNWGRVPAQQVCDQIAQLTTAPAWVLDGNFDAQRELVWGRADTIVWLDYPLVVTLPRLVKRNLGWYLSRKPVWAGNVMTLPQALSGMGHGLRGFRSKRRGYPEVLTTFTSAQTLRFRRPKETARWLEKL